MSYEGIKAVLFDLDETLIDVSKSLNAAHLAVAKNLKKFVIKKEMKMTLETLLEKIKIIDDSMNLVLEYDRDKWWQVLLDKLNIEYILAPEYKKNLTDKYWTSYTASVKPYSDAIATLKYLKAKGYLLGLITDTDGTPNIKKARIKKLALSKMFDVIIVAGEDTLNTKPNPEPYLKAARMLNVSSNECVYIGDKPFTDIKGALRARMKAILVCRRTWNIRTGNSPDQIIENLCKLRSIL